MPSLLVTYRCSLCQVESRATVSDLSEPSKSIPQRSSDLLKQTQAIREKLGGSQSDPIAELHQSLLEQEAHSSLRFATCPGCHARNPEGVAAQSNDRKQAVGITAGLFGGLTLIAYFAPLAAIAAPILVLAPMVLVALIARKRQMPVPWLNLGISLVISTLMVAAILLFRRAAPAVPLLLLVSAFVRKPRDSDKETAWTEAAKKIRFEGTDGYRFV
jgi:hypothetical protein